MDGERLADGVVVSIVSEAETRQLGHALAELVEPGCVIGLIGPLGAGKTFLSRAIAEALGVSPLAISSPTYILIHEYDGCLPVYHFDTYRLESKESFDDLGAAEYFDGEGVCLVEWADRVEDRLPERAWILRIEHESGDRRRISMKLPGPIRDGLLQRLNEAPL